MALMLLPFALFHFRGVPVHFLSRDTDIFSFPRPDLFVAGLWIYGGMWTAWLGRQIFLASKKSFSAGNFLAVFCPGILYGYCFLLGNNVFQILFPLFLAHGISYMAVLGLSLRRLDASWEKLPKILFAVLGTALLGGWASRFYGAHWVSFSDAYLSSPMDGRAAFLTGLYLVPLLCHYVFDGYIWKSGHADAKKIFGASG